MVKTHQEELKKLHHKLDSHADTSLDYFRQTAMVHTRSRSACTKHPVRFKLQKSALFLFN